eukprot:13323463-Ditylum_brightwellii.AAC.1
MNLNAELADDIIFVETLHSKRDCKHFKENAPVVNLCTPGICKHLHRLFKAASHHQAYCIQYAVLSSQIETSENRIDFDTDETTAIVDDLANAFIIKDKHLYIGEIQPIDQSKGVATIGGKDHRPSGIGKAKFSWKDDEEKIHTYIVD